MIEVVTLDAISGADLMKMKSTKHQYCIEEILPKGLSILTCDDLGWARCMALELGLYVSSGTEMWRRDVQQGTVLHMIHEDSQAVTGNRLRLMTKTVPKTLRFGIAPEITLDLAIYALNTFVPANPDTSLVVVELDTPLVFRNEKLYDTADTLLQYSRLKELAERYKIAVVVVQRYVTNLIGTNISSLKQAACISDVADCHLELRLKRNTKNRGVLRRYSRKYGNVVWEMAYTWPAQRWELKRRTRPEAKI